MRKALFGFTLLISVVVIVALVGCAPSQSKVDITATGFSPQTAKVKAGGEVTWTNRDDTMHTVTIGTVDSQAIKPGQTFTHTFAEAGTYDYYCRYQPKLRGTVTAK
jgi:plastocyanin